MKGSRFSIILCIFVLLNCILIFYLIGGMGLILKNEDYRKISSSLEFDDSFDNISMSKSCIGRLDRTRKNEIIHKMVKQINGRIVDVKNISDKDGIYSKKEIVRIYGYSRMIKNDRKYMGRKINFNIVITYNEKDNMTNIYFGSPIVNIEY